ncbi:MAG: multifunctional oxoglutarate decarboxylase/oxoglutarate dehydrogenase thiamine pyrophosphate-binding subunit/dihydrolipoyllysine-residue succinyltransferase subunit [Candidatus Eremiobacteraeota bacterium]|nr:multifunctional oxoglutarate decarboxylase/oxoglutarate dehydrogenase thiamine pyrophosphate-binding subunit/dihydrolipoyllysine-residue succinyltransferase subunit [Candidatus Eremiobacteraeota bacterium]
MPEMGESVTEGSIVEWRVKVGDFVAEGDPLVDVTTDKVDVEVPSTSAGVVTKLLAAEGATVPVGGGLVEIDANQTGAPATDGKLPQTAPASKPVAQAPSKPTSVAKNGEVLASPQAQRIARKLQVDVSRVRGSGPNGLILREDIEHHATENPSSYGAAGSGPGVASLPLPPISAQTKLTPLKGPAAALAGYMEQSLTIPTATSFRTLAVDALDLRRKELNAAIKAAGRSEKVSFTHVIAYALVRAAGEIPAITYSFRRDGKDAMRVEPGIHLGLAVDSQRKDGSRFLVVPVIKSADGLGFSEFHAKYEALVAKARDGKLGADDLTGASFTLTNPGGIGTVASVPRLMAGQGAIIAAGAIGLPAGFSNANEATLRSFGIGKVMQMTSTYDHRVVQGAQSGEYLKRVDELLQGKDGFYESIFSSLGLSAKPISAAPNASAVLSPQRAQTESGAAPSDEMMRAVASGMAIVASYRTHGHLAATLDPLGSVPIGDPALEPSNYGLTPSLQAAIPAGVLRVKVAGDTLADVLPRLKDTYSSTIAYEVEHISNTAQREWLRDWIESGNHRIEIPTERKVDVLQRLTAVESFERYLRKTFLGQKTFSLEGLDVMVPMLQEMLLMLAADGVSAAVLGMAHRGRLNTIAHVINMPYDEILAEFEAAHQRGEVAGAENDATGDVKYHSGASGEYTSSQGEKIAVALAHNPSHLEAVDPVVEGQTRALQTDHSQNMPSLNFTKAAPILIHGDAAFTGQGVVSEVLNLQSLPGYTTGGTLHIIANNQIGFTTDSKDSRSTRYSSDLAKGFDIPIIHVNADDVDACISAVHLAVEFRRKFGRDILIDLIGYRRFGHNEQDEPAYTQPEMYERIKAHPTARELFANKLIAQGLISPEKARDLVAESTERVQSAYKRIKGTQTPGIIADIGPGSRALTPVEANVDKAQLLKWSDELVSAPEGFQVSKKLTTQFERRKGIIQTKELADYAIAEGLAFASLLNERVPIRLTGQDTERGTFSHRHAVLHDPRNNTEHVPLQHLADAKASFEIHNSPLSEYACLGFEYGYSISVPSALVLWEAQFGDFNNGAQIIIDQFISAGQAKWGQSSRLTLLLPHGYEGQGPEHSSARLERFLQLSAEGNLRVANVSNAGNYYHLLRLQARDPHAAPLVIMTPKSLLRSEQAAGSLDEMATGSFAAVIDDPSFSSRKSEVERLILCSGKVYYDLINHDDYKKIKKTAIVRIELLAPLPFSELNAAISSYPNVKKLIWVQEEPKNMGARAHVRRRLLERKSDSMDIAYIGRAYRASPSEGYPGAHAVEQERIVTTALAE